MGYAPLPLSYVISRDVRRDSVSNLSFLLVSSSGSDRMERLLAIRRIPKIRRNLVTANRRDKTLVRIVTRAI